MTARTWPRLLVPARDRAHVHAEHRHPLRLCAVPICRWPARADSFRCRWNCCLARTVSAADASLGVCCLRSCRGSGVSPARGHPSRPRRSLRQHRECVSRGLGDVGSGRHLLYGKALAESPRSPASHFGMGTLLTQRRQHREALGHYQAAVEGWPDNADLRLNLAVALAAVGENPGCPRAVGCRRLTSRRRSDRLHRGRQSAALHDRSIRRGEAEIRAGALGEFQRSRRSRGPPESERITGRGDSGPPAARLTHFHKGLLIGDPAVPCRVCLIRDSRPLTSVVPSSCCSSSWQPRRPSWRVDRRPRPPRRSLPIPGPSSTAVKLPASRWTTHTDGCATHRRRSRPKRKWPPSSVC